MNKTFTTKNGIIVGLQLGQIASDQKRGTLLLSKLLHANQFVDLDGSDDEEAEEVDSQMQTINLDDNFNRMQVTMALTDG